MKRWAICCLGLLFAGILQGCGDQLSEMQERMSGTWQLESRKLADGTLLEKPQISGMMTWIPIESRKGHVTLNLETPAKGDTPRRFDYAASTYEISTSAITRSRHLLVRQGYRSSATLPFTSSLKVLKVKGKISMENGSIEISHDLCNWRFEGDRMVASYEGAYEDTWKRLH